MPFEVRYSSRAYAEYEDILKYLSNKFGVSVAAKIDMYFEQIIDQIALNPLLYPYSCKVKNIRRCVISPQTTIYYRFNGEFVEIASFRGNKMNPETLNL